MILIQVGSVVELVCHTKFPDNVWSFYLMGSIMHVDPKIDIFHRLTECAGWQRKGYQG